MENKITGPRQCTVTISFVFTYIFTESNRVAGWRPSPVGVGATQREILDPHLQDMCNDFPKMLASFSFKNSESNSATLHFMTFENGFPPLAKGINEP